MKFIHEIIAKFIHEIIASIPPEITLKVFRNQVLVTMQSKKTFSTVVSCTHFRNSSQEILFQVFKYAVAQYWTGLGLLRFVTAKRYPCWYISLFSSRAAEVTLFDGILVLCALWIVTPSFSSNLSC